MTAGLAALNSSHASTSQLASPNEWAALAAAGAIAPIDLEDPLWVPNAVFDILKFGHWEAIDEFAASLRAGPETALAEAEAAVALHLEENPDDWPAKPFAAAILLR